MGAKHHSNERINVVGSTGAIGIWLNGDSWMATASGNAWVNRQPEKTKATMWRTGKVMKCHGLARDHALSLDPLSAQPQCRLCPRWRSGNGT